MVDGSSEALDRTRASAPSCAPTPLTACTFLFESGRPGKLIEPCVLQVRPICNGHDCNPPSSNGDDGGGNSFWCASTLLPRFKQRAAALAMHSPLLNALPSAARCVCYRCASNQDFGRFPTLNRKEGSYSQMLPDE